MKNILVVLSLFLSNVLYSQTKMNLIKGGSYKPFFGSTETPDVQVQDFYLDVTPVTHQQFAEFVKNNPKWQKGNVKKIFADENYLNSWALPNTAPTEFSNKPVNYISWFAAKTYCECQGKRLPTLEEWEYVAMASPKKRDARKDSLFIKKILSGYETPKTYLFDIGKTEANIWGIKDLHGVVWEWVYDYNSVILGKESRKRREDNADFCGAESVGTTDLMNYAAFIRFALRASLKANFCIANLGFRCAKSIPTKTPNL